MSTKQSIRFYKDRELFMKGIDYSYYYEQSENKKNDHHALSL